MCMSRRLVHSLNQSNKLFKQRINSYNYLLHFITTIFAVDKTIFLINNMTNHAPEYILIFNACDFAHTTVH